jgi:ketosteroid isomerase-like protein
MRPFAGSGEKIMARVFPKYLSCIITLNKLFMKKTICLALACVLVLSAFAQKNEDAIKKVIADETTAYYGNDAKGMLNQWHIVPQTTMFVLIDQDRVIEHKGASMTLDSVAAMMAGSPETVNVERTNWTFCMSGDCAYVTFDQSIAGQKTCSHETRFMEKINGDWKIASSNVVLLNRK